MVLPVPTGHVQRSTAPGAPAGTLRRVIRVAASKAGAPYPYGAQGARRFACSGLTTWVFHWIGRDLPRTFRAHAPRPGRRVHRAQIWTTRVTYGRVR